MIDRIIDFSANNRFAVILVCLGAALAGWYAIRSAPLDAVPDLSDTQVILYSRWDRSPDIVEDQVTYPIVSALLGAPKVQNVRGFSDFGYSFVYVIFEDGTDLHWARSRTLEYLAAVQPRLPQGVKTELGPDATGLGWVFQYVLEDSSGKHSLADLRSYQDWYLRFHLKSVPGVADVAAVGGFTRQYQVNVDPNRLYQYGLSMEAVAAAVRGGNSETGGRLLEIAGSEYMIRGRGYVQSLADIEQIVLSTSADGTPIRVKDVGQVTVGPDLRRGVADLDGRGDAVSGIVIMRQGENALEVIRRVKARLAEVESGLPEGVKVVPIYDRSALIGRSMDTLKQALFEITATVALIILLFLWHVPSAMIPIITIPVAMLISFIPFRAMDLTANIMSLAGIAIAIGALVDASIVVVEQSHKKLEGWNHAENPQGHHSAIVAAIKEVGAPSFYALMVIAVSFLPVLALEQQEGRMFKPLAYTKNLAMMVGAVLAITLDPALRLSLMRLRPYDFRPRWLCGLANRIIVGKIYREDGHPISRTLMRWYQPIAEWTLQRRWLVVGMAVAVLIGSVPAYLSLGSEFMPPLDEGDLFYMPSTMPGISIAEAERLLQVTDRMLKQFPEVDRVLGKAGRAETPTDPAPLSMLETVITLKPQSEWRRTRTWYSSWAPEWFKPLLRHITPDHISREQLVDEMHAALSIPGLSNSWTMPIRARIDMLSTGIRTPIGLKIQGADLARIEEIGASVEAALARVPGTRSVFAERTAGGYFLDFVWNREALSRYGLSVEAAQAAVQNAIGGENVTSTVEGRQRFPVNVRYLRDFRSDLTALGRVLVPAADGRIQVPLSQLAEIRTVSGPSMIRNENGMLTGYVYVDVSTGDLDEYVKRGREALSRTVATPPGYAILWSGQYEVAERVAHRLAVVVPLTLLLIFLLIYLNTRSVARSAIILCSVPFAAVGAVWLLWALDYNMSIAVWVGMIALLGVDAETGVFMLLYLDLAWEKARKEGRLNSLAEVRRAVLEGSVQRIRPKFMTAATDFIGLLPILWATGTGADMMKRIAAPIVGGMVTSLLLELLVYPAVYEIWRWDFGLKRQLEKTDAVLVEATER